MAEIIVPTAWCVLTSGERSFVCNASTVEEALNTLTTQYPSLKPRLLNEVNEVPSYINIFLDGQHIRELQGKQTPIHKDSTVIIVPALVGG